MWLPDSSIQRTRSVTEIIRCYYKYNNKKKVLQKGQKPASFPSNKVITQKDLKRSLRQEREPSNPVRTGFQFVEYLNDNPNTTYDELSADIGITKARVCQMIALCKRLPSEITDFLVNTDKPEILKHFTERRLRPLTLLASDKNRIKKFDKMKEALSSGGYSQNSLDF